MHRSIGHVGDVLQKGVLGAYTLLIVDTRYPTCWNYSSCFIYDETIVLAINERVIILQTKFQSLMNKMTSLTKQEISLTKQNEHIYFT